MRASRLLLLTQLAIGCALLASSALYVHYLDPVNSDFCGLRSGCEAVRRTPLAYFGSRFVSLPLFSMLAYAALLGLSLRCGSQLANRAPRGKAAESLSQRVLGDPNLLLFAASGLGALCALALIAYQAFGIGQFCWLCLVVDASAIVAAAGSFGLAWTRRPGSVSLGKALPAQPTLITGVLLVAGPLIWSAVQPPLAVPEGVTSLYVPGKINIVEFADFQCPYCRKLHAVLEPLIEEYGDDINFVRLNRPLERHRMARPAAHAAICAVKQGKGKAMADELFHIKLSTESIQSAARTVGLDISVFNGCLAAPDTAQALQRQERRLSEEQFKGLPTTYVGQKLLIGVRSEAAFREAFDRARLPPSAGISGGLYVALWAALAALVWVFPWLFPVRPQSATLE